MITPETAIMTSESLLEHWLEHRRLTRRTIEVFPEEHLYTFTPTEPLRTFGAMMNEVQGMVHPSLNGLIAGNWSTTTGFQDLADKASLLAAHDEVDTFIRETWPSIPVNRFIAVEQSYFPKPAPLVVVIVYLVDNEIHHRGQGYIYLRLLGIEPPSFYQRS